MILIPTHTRIHGVVRVLRLPPDSRTSDGRDLPPASSAQRTDDPDSFSIPCTSSTKHHEPMVTLL